MRSERKIVLISFLCGLLAWLTDGLMDYAFFYEAPFWDLMLFRVPPSELYTRILALVLFLLLGVIASSMVVGRRRVEEHLRLERDRAQSYLDIANVIIVVLDAEQRVTLLNRKGFEVIGYDEDEIIGRNWFDHFIPASERAEVLKNYRLLLDGNVQELKNLHNSVLSADGKKRLISWHNRLLRDDNGEIVGTLSSGEDVTQRVETAEALRASERRFRTLMEQAPLGIEIYDTEGTLLQVNQTWQQIWHAKAEEVVNEYNLFEDAHVRRAELYPQIKRAFAGESVVLPVIEFVPEDVGLPGRQRWVKPYAYPLLENDGSVQNVIFMYEDVTERRESEIERQALSAQLREQARQTRQILDTVPEGVILLDKVGHVVMANPVGESDLRALAGVEIGDQIVHLGSRPLHELLSPPQWGGWHEVEMDGAAPRYFETIAREIRSGDTVTGWVLVLRDVTRERERQQQIQHQERLAVVGQLAGGIAHDFNNYLTSIILYANILLRRVGLSTEATRACETIVNESHRAAELVERILDFSRRSSMKMRPLDLRSFIEEIGEILRRTIPEHIRLSLKSPSSEAPLIIEADPTRLQQVLMNLAFNARDAMPSGGTLEIRLSHLQITPEQSHMLAGGEEMGVGTWILLSVSDTGTGMTEDVQRHLFEPFFTTKAPGKGTGLGLAQVYGIVKQHRGVIDVSSEIGKGTTFHIYLPAVTTQALLEDERQPALPGGSGETILLVEDNEKLREAGRDVLRSLGYRVLTAANGREALEFFRADPEEGVDMLITDMVMPEMSGQELVARLQDIAPECPVLAITGYAQQDVENLQELGFSEVIRKPFDAEILAHAVRRILDKTAT